MKVITVSEHYFPRVGGTVNYVHETLCALTALGVEAELWVPGPAPEGWLPAGLDIPPYQVRWIDSNYPAKGDPTREQRYWFCKAVDLRAAELLSDIGRPDLLHVLFGLFVMEVLDTERLREGGMPCVATVHNVPPMECCQTGPNADLFARIKEALRLNAVKLKNNARLKKHRYDAYIVPSTQVHDLLLPVICGGQIDVIAHGPTGVLQAQMSPPADRIPNGHLHVLTAGGYAPHKRQHIIPATADALRDKGVAFVWDVVGPAGRIRGYFDDIQSEVERRGLKGLVHLHQTVPFADLANFYDAANIYVQPSIEEGFCITALDAAAAGLPVIGGSAGALPEIVDISGGIQVKSDFSVLAESIARFSRGALWQNSEVQSALVKEAFSWSTAAIDLKARYQSLLETNRAAPHE